MEQLPHPRTKPSAAVREIENQDGAVLLDIRQGVCMSMTPVGIRIWQMLKLNYSFEQITECLATDFTDVPINEIDRDVRVFVADLEQNGLLVADQPVDVDRLGLLDRLLVPAHRQVQCEEGRLRVTGKSARFLTLKCFLGLLIFDLFRLGNNFTRVRTVVQRWPTAPKLALPSLVDQVCDAMRYACVWYPTRVLCLQRSAVMTCVLRNCGVPAQMVIGAQKFPFKAHAWTEVNCRAINERRDVQNIYSTWERC